MDLVMFALNCEHSQCHQIIWLKWQVLDYIVLVFYKPTITIKEALCLTRQERWTVDLRRCDCPS